MNRQHVLPTIPLRYASGRCKLFRVICVVFGITMLGGCSYHGAAYIDTIPTGAEVVNVDDDTVLGQTPIKIWWQDKKKERKRINVRLQKDGYLDKVTSFWVTLRHSNKEQALGEPQHVEVKLDKSE